MTLAFGQTTPEEYAALAIGGPKDDKVGAGNYQLKLIGFYDLEPRDEKPGTFFVKGEIVNSELHEGKKISMRFNYDPDPHTKGRKTMNEISKGGMKAVCLLANSELLDDDSGSPNVALTIKTLAESIHAVIPVSVGHDGEYQNVDPDTSDLEK